MPPFLFGGERAAKQELDCFVASLLAMTIDDDAPPTDVILREGGVSSTPRVLGNHWLLGILDHPPSRMMTTEHTFALSRRHSPEVCKFIPPPKKREGAGKTGCALHPRSRVQSSKQKRTRAYRFSGNTPAFPAQWFYGLSSCSPRRDHSLLVTVAPKKRELL